MTPSVARKVIGSFQNVKAFDDENKISELNEREEQILNLMAQGKSYNAIADEVYLSIDGVYYHIRHIYENLCSQSCRSCSAGNKEAIDRTTQIVN